MSDGMVMIGGCACGDLRYQITTPLLTAYICHCHRCQKRTGSAFGMSVIIAAHGFRLISGSAIQTERSLEAGERNVSTLCGVCYSRIHTQRTGRKTLNLRVGTLDNTAFIRPVAQFWTSSAQPWAVVQSDILSYAEQPTDLAPLLAAWTAANGAMPGI